MFNFDDLTLGDIEDVETYAGRPVKDLADPDAPQAKLKTALAWILKRKDDPTYTIKDARKLTRAELNALVGGDEDDEDELKKEQ